MAWPRGSTGLQIPLLFGLGTAVVTMVGAATGAGQHARARQTAWTASLLAVAVTEGLGLVVAIFPSAWIGLFTADPGVLEAGSRYLRVVAPSYGAVGVGMMLYFACQGRARMLWPFLAGAGRLLVAAGGGWLLAQRGFGLAAVFLAIAAGSAVFGGVNLLGMLRDQRQDEPARLA